MKCTTDEEEDLITCAISCPRGYGFSGPVLPEYNCGKNTSYLWPHQSPDNPRCILPACTSKCGQLYACFFFFFDKMWTNLSDSEKILNILDFFSEMKLTDEAKYEFKTKFPMECVSEHMLVEVKQQVTKRAAEMTKSLSCLQDGTCSLDEPQIRGCDTAENSKRRKRATGDKTHINKELDIKVSITYHGKFASLSAPGR